MQESMDLLERIAVSLADGRQPRRLLTGDRRQRPRLPW